MKVGQFYNKVVLVWTQLIISFQFLAALVDYVLDENVEKTCNFHP